MDDERLMLLVSENECLFNKCSKDLKLPEKKRKAWMSIAKALGVTDEQCMRRWTTLRNRYAKECRRARREERENTAVISFGQMIVSTISGMSNAKQVKAMQRVTDVVMALALEPEE